MSAQPVNASLSGAFFALVRRDLLLAFRRRTELLFPVIFLLVVAVAAGSRLRSLLRA